MANIFLSYSSKDRDQAHALRDALVEAGYSVFWDVETPIGVNWNEWIRQHLTEAGCVVVLWSRASVQSPNVQHEAQIARELGKLVPVTLDSVSPLELPMGFFTTQAAPLAGWTGESSSAHLQPLLNAIAAMLSRSFVRQDDSGPVELSLLRTLAAQGDAGARRVLGAKLLVGQGVEQDPAAAAALYRQAAYQGEPEAQRVYSFFLRNGSCSVVVDPEEGIRLLKAAAESGLPRAQYDLAAAYSSGSDVAQNIMEAARLAQLASEQGNTDAMLLLAGFYYAGRGVEMNHARCAGLLHKAAEEGIPVAFHNLGVLYQYGHGVEQSDASAFAMFALAAGKNHAEAFAALGNFYEEGRTKGGRDYQKALDCYEMSVKLGNAAAQAEYDALKAKISDTRGVDGGSPSQTHAVPGDIRGGDREIEPLLDADLLKNELLYRAANAIEENDLLGFRKIFGDMVTDASFVPTSFADAARLLEPLATRDNPIAQSLFGTLCAFGRGVPQSAREACRWFRPAAKASVPDAVFRLGVLLAEDDSLKEDGEDLLACLTEAAKLHHPVALYKVGEMNASGTIVERSYESAALFFEFSAEAGYAPAQLVIGLYYSFGSGVEKDERKGFEYLEKSVRQGWIPAYFYLARCYQEGWGTRASDEAAIPLLRHGAANGDRNAQSMLGFCYLNGRGVAKSMYDAAIHLRNAADSGDCESQYAIGQLYEMGLGVGVSMELAERYYALAAAQGHVEARQRLDAS